MLFAMRRHQGQFREGNLRLPYVTHPIEVTLKLADLGKIEDEDLLCVALLHDVLEETPTTIKEITRHFGPRVSKLVQELTRQDFSGSWIERADRQLAEIAVMSAEAQTIKLADRLSNTEEALRFRVDAKLQRYLWQSSRLLSAIPREVNPNLWDALHELVKCESSPSNHQGIEFSL